MFGSIIGKHREDTYNGYSTTTYCHEILSFHLFSAVSSSSSFYPSYYFVVEMQLIGLLEALPWHHPPSAQVQLPTELDLVFGICEFACELSNRTTITIMWRIKKWTNVSESLHV